MPLADSKRAQTAINLVGKAIIKARGAVDAMEAVQTLYVAANVDPTGTPLEGNEAMMANAIASLRTEVDKPVWDALIAAISPTHMENAL